MPQLAPPRLCSAANTPPRCTESPHSPRNVFVVCPGTKPEHATLDPGLHSPDFEPDAVSGKDVRRRDLTSLTRLRPA